MNQGEIVRLADFGLSGAEIAAARTEAVETLIAGGTRARSAGAAGGVDRRGARGDNRRSRPRRDLRSDPRRNAPLRRRRSRASRPGLAPRQRLYPARRHWRPRRTRRFRPDHPRGIRRPRARQGGDVRRLRGTVARLYRRRLARHALGDRRRADPGGRHGGAEAPLLAENRQRRDPADRRVHRTQHRLRPRQLAHARHARGRRLCRQRRQDLDHPSGARRPDDAARSHQSRRARLQGPVDAAGREAARRQVQPVSGRRHVGRRDRSARLPRHEGIRDRLRQFPRRRPKACSAASRARASSS